LVPTRPCRVEYCCGGVAGLTGYEYFSVSSGRFTTLPSASISSTGGAGKQQSAIGGFVAAPISCSVRLDGM